MWLSPQVSEKQLYEVEKQFKSFEAMINSMTPEERANPDLMIKSPSRRRRVAEGAGRKEADVSVSVLGLEGVSLKELKNSLFFSTTPTQ